MLQKLIIIHINYMSRPEKKDEETNSMIHSKIKQADDILTANQVRQSMFQGIGNQIEVSKSVSKPINQLSKDNNLNKKGIGNFDYQNSYEPTINIQNNTKKKFETVRNYKSIDQKNTEHTLTELRQKINLQNMRLKANLQILQEDINYYQKNQLKIAAILRESKEKLKQYKVKIKQKSKRNEQLLDNNLALKKLVNKLEQKNQYLSNYSIWQQKQLTEFKRQINQKGQEQAQSIELYNKIEKLQNRLKEYERSIETNNQIKSIDAQNESNLGLVGYSYDYLSEGIIKETIYNEIKSFNEMDSSQIQNIKQKQSSQNESEKILEINQILKEKNSHIQFQLVKMQNENEALKSEVRRTAVELQIQRSKLKEQISHFQLKISNFQANINKSQQELKNVKYELKAKQQFWLQDQERKLQMINDLKQERQEIYEKIKIKSIQFQEALELRKEIQQNYIKQNHEQKIRFSEEQQKYQKIISISLAKNKELLQSYSNLQIEKQQIYKKLMEAQNFIIEDEQKVKDYEEKIESLNLANHSLIQQNEQLRQIINQIKNSSRDLSNKKRIEEQLPLENISHSIDENLYAMNQKINSYKQSYQDAQELIKLLNEENGELRKYKLQMKKMKEVTLQNEQQMNKSSNSESQQNISYQSYESSFEKSKQSGQGQRHNQASSYSFQSSNHVYSNYVTNNMSHQNFQYYHKLIDNLQKQLKASQILIEQYKVQILEMQHTSQQKIKILQQNFILEKTEIDFQLESQKQTNKQYEKNIKQLILENAQLKQNLLQKNMILESERISAKKVLNDFKDYAQIVKKKEKQVEILESQKLNLITQNQNSLQIVQRLGQEVEQLRLKNTKLQIENKNTYPQVEEYKQLLNKIQKHKQTLLQGQQLSTQQIKLLESQLSQYKSLKQNLQIELNLCITSKQELQKSLKSLKQQNKNINQQLQNRNQSLQQKMNDIIILNQSIEEIKLDYSNQIQKLQSQVQTIESRAQQLQHELENTKQKLRCNIQQAAKVLSDFKQIEFNYSNVKLKLEKLQAQNQHLNRKLEQKISELIDVQENLQLSRTDHESRVNSLKESQSKQKQQLASQSIEKNQLLNKQNEQLRLKIINMQDYFERQKQNSKLEVDNLIGQIQNFKKQITNFDGQRNKINQQLSHLYALKQLSRQQVEDISNLNLKIEQTQKQFDLQSKKFNIKLSQRQIQKSNLLKSLNQKQNEINFYEQKIQILQNQLVSSKNKLSKQQVEIAQLESSREQLKAKLIIIQQQYEDLIKQMKKEIQLTAETTKIKQVEINQHLGNISKLKAEVEMYRSDYEQIKTQFASERQKYKIHDQFEQIVILKAERSSYLEMNQKLNNDLVEMKAKLSQIQNKYSIQIQNMCEEQRQKLLQVEKLYGSDTKKINECLLNKTSQVVRLQTELNILTEKQLYLQQELQESNEVLDSLRNEAISKNHEIYELKQVIEKLNEENEQLKIKGVDNQNKLQNHKLNEAQLQIQKLLQINHQLQARQSILENEIKEKINSEKELNIKIKQLNNRANKTNSEDSFMSKSKIFADDKNQSLFKQLEEYKLKLQSAQAYIYQLEECTHDKEGGSNIGHKQKLQETLKQNEDLKLRLQYLEAYTNQLEQLNKSQKSSLIEKKQGNREIDNINIVYYQSGNIKNKIDLLIQFVQKYQKNSTSFQKQEQLKEQLNHQSLQELLSTIFCRLERDSIYVLEKQSLNFELNQENDRFRQEIKILTDNNNYLKKKVGYLQIIQSKLNDTQQMLKQQLINKMKREEDYAAKLTYISQIEVQLKNLRVNQKQIENNKEKQEIKIIKESKQSLEILEEENQSDSMMSQDIDSQIPSSISQSKQFKSSIENFDPKKSKNKISKFKNTQSQEIPIIKQKIDENQKHHLQFLQKCIYHILQLQNKIKEFEINLNGYGLKFDLLQTQIKNIHNLQSVSEQQPKIINKLEQIEAFIANNNRQLYIYLQKNESEVLNFIRDLFRIRIDLLNSNEEENRKKIEDYLQKVERQIVQNNKVYEEQLSKIDKLNMEQKVKNSQSSNHNNKYLNLQEIKEDVVAQDKVSSIINAKGQVQVIRSMSNSQGVTCSIDANQLKANYDEVLNELHIANDEIQSKKDAIKILNLKYVNLCQQLLAQIDQSCENIQSIQFIKFFNNLKQKLLEYFPNLAENEDSVGQNDLKHGRQKIQMLIQSNKKKMEEVKAQKQPKYQILLFQKICKMTEDQTISWCKNLQSKQLLNFSKNIKGIVAKRSKQCKRYFGDEKNISILIQILTKYHPEQRQPVEQNIEEIVNKLSSHFSQQQMKKIIESEYDEQVYQTLVAVINQQDSSDQQSSEEKDDFSRLSQVFFPDVDRIQLIKEEICQPPTEFSHRIHMKILQLVKIQQAEEYYQSIKDFYCIIYKFQKTFIEQIENLQIKSRQNSIKMKELIDESFDKIDFVSLQKYDKLQIKNTKHRSSSYSLGFSQNMDPSFSENKKIENQY